MRLLWKQWKTAGADYRGVAEDQIAPAVEQATGLSLAREIAEWTEGTSDPDYEASVRSVRRELRPPARCRCCAFRIARNKNGEHQSGVQGGARVRRLAGTGCRVVRQRRVGCARWVARNAGQSRYAVVTLCDRRCDRDRCLSARRADALRGQARHAAPDEVLARGQSRKARALRSSCAAVGLAERAPRLGAASTIRSARGRAAAGRCSLARSVRIPQTESADVGRTVATDDLLAGSGAARSGSPARLAPAFPTT